MREFGALLAAHGFLEDGEDIFQLPATRSRPRSTSWC